MSPHRLFDAENLIDSEDELAEVRDGLAEVRDELAEVQDEHISPLVLGAAVAGLLVGLFLWGSLAMSVASSAGDLFDEDTSTDGAPTTAETASPAPTAADAAEATPPPDPSVNRLDCDAIRGTDYRTPEERQWFIANCLTR